MMIGLVTEGGGEEKRLLGPTNTATLPCKLRTIQMVHF